jgi:acyl-CoA reductase-like NAD-dependent aldehyde dehydrogenase
MGDLRDPNTWVGPIISERQRQRVRTHIEDARQKGATVLTGGDWIGNRCRPTILTGVTEDMTVCREETFGPVTSVYPVADLDEAITRANDTEYGLSSAIFTRDINKALRFMREIRAGMVHINAPTINDEPHVPFGGVGDSGFGREGTDIDVDTLTEWKWVTIQLPPA